MYTNARGTGWLVRILVVSNSTFIAHRARDTCGTGITIIKCSTWGTLYKTSYFLKVFINDKKKYKIYIYK